ncbi:hypothetical protein VQ643_11330 [Pseudomonas sp. F1_0610]|uniref:hypothetical protein n=1 Tax=Pseudomonas sp. F1_0610 TaxID=3114284 RepID=UPI0039C2E96C
MSQTPYWRLQTLLVSIVISLVVSVFSLGMLLNIPLFTAHFLNNLWWLWGSVVIVPVVLWGAKANQGIILGALTVFCLYQVGFTYIASGWSARDGLAWLLYFFGLPGGYIGAFIAIFVSKKLEHKPQFAIGFMLSFLGVLFSYLFQLIGAFLSSL